MPSIDSVTNNMGKSFSIDKHNYNKNFKILWKTLNLLTFNCERLILQRLILIVKG